MLEAEVNSSSSGSWLSRRVCKTAWLQNCFVLVVEGQFFHKLEQRLYHSEPLQASEHWQSVK